MLINIIIGCFLIVLTTIVHATATNYVLHLVQKQSNAKLKHRKYSKMFWISAIVLLMLLASIIESVIWAITYLALDAIQTLEQALYFSIVTFTTLGFGDITLSESWRLLASLEAANGIIIFGWSTAIVMAAVQKLYFHK
jgi:Ion channel